MKKIILFILVIALVFTFAACGNDENDENTNNSAAEQNADSATTKTELTVWGMTCVRCINKITDALLDMNGVVNVSVDLSAEKVTVEHEPELDIDTVKDAITREGFNIP